MTLRGPMGRDEWIVHEALYREDGKHCPAYSCPLSPISNLDCSVVRCN